MAAFSASMVKELRERTGLGMMECKKALVEAGGDIDKAIDDLRKSSGMKAAKKAGRIAAEGIVAIKVADDNSYGVMVEVNSETDFVARDDGFLGFVNQVVEKAFSEKQTDVVKPEDMPEEVVAKEKEIFVAQARESGKPEEIIEKMISGRINKFLSESSLVNQPFVKDPEIKVGKLVKDAGGDVQSFTRFEVGEGIEKEEVDFAAEVAAQVGAVS
ncbi:UNVERIFIED_CONTAM: hypothetical protein GTU68_007170 [Idotea baltica]|nr:hypothetical protein [Idotea baltica]